MKTRAVLVIFILLLGLSMADSAFAQAGRIYTSPDPSAAGGIVGRAPLELTHAMAVERDRVHVYLAALDDEKKGFRFEHLPTGKYDLILVAKNGAVFEGLALGDDIAALSPTQLANLKARVAAADTFFNRWVIHRAGVTGLNQGGDAVVLAFVERFRANDILKQSGDKLDQLLRRFEVIELHQATDDWQMIGTRHVYREGEKIPVEPHFYKHARVDGLGNIRVIETVKDLGLIALTPP